MPVSPRFLIDYPLGTEVPNIDADITKVVNAIESLATQFGQGTLANRPVSTPGSPGKQGRIYVVTSGTEINQIHYDYGTGWIHLNPDQTPADGSITTAKLADNSVNAAKIIDGSVGAAEIADGSVRWEEMAANVKPSQGAGAGAEALRQLGTAGHQAASGSHGGQHHSWGVDPLPTAGIHGQVLSDFTVPSSKIAGWGVSGNNSVANPKIMGGSTITNTGEGGHCLVSFPVVFNAVHCVVAMNGDTNANKWYAELYTMNTSWFQIICAQWQYGNWTPLQNSTVRVNWIAWGQ